MSNLIASPLGTLSSRLIQCLLCIRWNYIIYTTIIFAPGSSQQFPKRFSWICFHPSPTHSLCRPNEIFLKHKWEHTTRWLQNFQWFSLGKKKKKKKTSYHATRPCTPWSVAASKSLLSHPRAIRHLPHWISCSSWHKSTFFNLCSWHSCLECTFLTFCVTSNSTSSRVSGNVSLPGRLRQYYLQKVTFFIAVSNILTAS